MFGKKSKITKKNPGLAAAMIDFIVPPKKKHTKVKTAAKGAAAVGVLGAIGATVAEKRAKKLP